MKQHTVYVTPAGFICTCSHIKSTIAGGEAARTGYQHKETHTNAVLVDYRLGVSTREKA